MREFKPTSPRELFSTGAAVGLATLLDIPGSASAEEWTHASHGGRGDVTEFGAVGNAQNDDSAGFQGALDAVPRAGDGTVYVPSDGVTSQGSYGYAPSHPSPRNQGRAKPGDNGAALLVTAGGQKSGQPYLSLNSNSMLSGLTIYHPEQVMDDVPMAYPWAVLSRGIWVDAIYDIGRVANVHFNSPWNSNSKVYQWQMQPGEAFIFVRSDRESVLNTFCLGYHFGYKFVRTTTSSYSGNFLGIGTDDCKRAIRVEQCTSYALLITNGALTSFHGIDRTMVKVTSTNDDVVRLDSCAFRDSCDHISKIAGKGTGGFDGYTFVQCGRDGSRTAVRATSGGPLINGPQLLENQPHIPFGKDVEGR